MDEYVNAISGDRPLGEGDEDRLGFAPLADRLALALVSQTSPEGMVVGIEGAWGSGKSSLVFLTLKALRALKEKQPEVVEFRPWLVGDRDALLVTLFGELSKAVASISLASGDATAATNKLLKDAAEKLRSFAAQLEGPAKALKLLELFVPGAGLVASTLEGLSGAAKSIETAPSLTKMKDDLNSALRKLPRRIVVMIDDVDRLEPAEAIELLRLVRSVADFPNVVYVLCYDQPVLAKSVQVAAKIEDGRAYLEKIIQVIVPVPTPEPFDLRRWFAHDLAKFAAARTAAEASRIETVIDQEGGRRLTTPRSVVRSLNSLAFVWPALTGEVDLPDLVWLHLIRAQNPEYYRWIEAYCAEAAAAQSWRVRVDDETHLGFVTRLADIIKSENRTFDKRTSWYLADYLPGISPVYEDKKDPIRLFGRLDERARDEVIASKRLKSPDHYRLYFALTQPENAPRQHDYDSFWRACDKSSEDVIAVLLDWAGHQFKFGGSKLDLMLDRLRGHANEALEPDIALTILRAFSDGMDAMLAFPEFDSWVPTGWRMAEKLTPALIDKARSLHSDGITQTFATGRALHWLTNLLSDELAARGRFGRRAVGQRSLEDEELRAVETMMVERYRSIGFAAILDGERAGVVLRVWQAIDLDFLKSVVADSVVTDAGMLATLRGLSSEVRSTRGDYFTLTRDLVEPLAVYGEMRSRVEALAVSGGPYQAEAENIISMFVSGDERWSSRDE